MDVTDEAIEDALRRTGHSESCLPTIRANLNNWWARSILAHARTIMEFQAFRQEVSDAVLYCFGQGMSGFHKETLERFIIAKPDPDEELEREVVKNFADAPHYSAKNVATEAIRVFRERLRADGRLTDAT